MCDSCGCGDPNVVSVDVHESILAVNDRTAAHNREHLARQGIFAVNLMGSPGAGKTAVLEATARALAGRRRLGVIAGDLETERDADRLRAVDVPAAAITTGTACHLDAQMLHRALHDFPTSGLDYLFVENVGNLVCPAVYDLGQSVNVVALSVTEGEDKPLKYPVMFRKADLVLLTKVDLLPHLDLDVPALEAGLARVAPAASVLRVSARTAEGVDAWVDWLQARAAAAPGPSAQGHAPAHTHPGGHGIIDAAAVSSGRMRT